MYQFAHDTVDLEQLRARLQRMSDEALVSFGKAAKYMCSPRATMNKPPLEQFVIQLEESRAEWRRRRSHKT